MMSTFWNYISLIGVIGGLALYYLSIIILNTHTLANMLQPGLNQLFFALMSRPKCWIVIFFVPIIALIPDFIYISWNKIFNPTPVDNLIIMKSQEAKKTNEESPVKLKNV